MAQRLCRMARPQLRRCCSAWPAGHRTTSATRPICVRFLRVVSAIVVHHVRIGTCPKPPYWDHAEYNPSLPTSSFFLFTVTIFRLTRKLTLSPPACSRCALCMCFLADTKCPSGANWPTKISKTVFMDPMIRLPPRSCAVSPIRMTVRHHPCFVCTHRMCTPRFSARQGTGLSP